MKTFKQFLNEQVLTEEECTLLETIIELQKIVISNANAAVNITAKKIKAWALTNLTNSHLAGDIDVLKKIVNDPITATKQLMANFLHRAGGAADASAAKQTLDDIDQVLDGLKF